jgi:hypothetical protein
VTSAPENVKPWNANLTNVTSVTGRLLWNGTPISGARVAVGKYEVPQATGKAGRFSYDLDDTVAGRHVIHVVSLAHAHVDGKTPTAAEKQAIMRARGGFTSAFAITGVKAQVQKDGSVRVTGTVQDAAHDGPPPVHLVTYELSGRITDANGKPVQGAYVVTRTQDRDYWTRSNASDANGHYTSFFPASDETDDNPVTISVGVALGKTSYGGNLGTNVEFARLKSSVLNVKLGSGADYKLDKPRAYTASIQSGLAIGVQIGGKVIRPLSERWPTTGGKFSMVLPGSVRGRSLSFFEDQIQVKSRFVAKPGGAADLKFWPKNVSAVVPRDIASATVPSHS